MAFRAGQILTAADLNSITLELESRIGHIELAANQAAFTFNDIPQDYRHLRIVVNAQITHTVIRNLYLRFNGAGAGYAWIRSAWDGAGTPNPDSNLNTGFGAFGRAGANWRSTITCVIPNYSVSGITTGWSSWGTGINNTTTASEIENFQCGGRWNGSVPITDIDLTAFGDAEYTAGTFASLYGER